MILRILKSVHKLRPLEQSEEWQIQEFKNNISEYKTYDEAILDMKAGRIKAVAIDEVYAIYNNENKG